MKAITLQEFGGPEVMKLAEVPLPATGPNDLLIRVHASSVNRPDLVQREGHYPPAPGESDILGLEVAGTVEAVGADVDGFTVGQAVIALVGGGGYAEYVRVHAGHALPMPQNLSFEQAACICEAYITAWLNVFKLGGLENGQSALLHGGGGGVNTAAIQICRQLVPEATLFVTASTGKLARVKDLGAHHVIDYREEDFAERVRELTNKQGVQVILDHVGSAYLAGNLRALAVGGRLVVIGVMSGGKAQINLALLMVKRQQLIGSVLRSRPEAEKAAIIAEFGKTVLPLFASGQVVPLVSQVFPLQAADEAHRMMETSAHFGKIVLKVSDA